MAPDDDDKTEEPSSGAPPGNGGVEPEEVQPETDASPEGSKDTQEEAPKEAPKEAPQEARQEETPAEDGHGRHIHIPPHEPGFRGTVKAMRAVLSQLGKRRVLAASMTIAVLSIGGLILFSGFSFWWTSQPSFCARCHPMQKYVDAWEKGPHSEVNCERCHLTPGLFGFLGGKIAGLQVVMNYVRGNYEDYSFNAAVGNASCLQCHEGILSKNIHSTGATDVLVSHKNIIEAGAKCMSCHSTVGHGNTVPIGSQTHPTMATCLQCHNGEIAPLDCDLCHVGKKPGQVTIPAGMPSASLPSPSASSVTSASGTQDPGGGG